jgi:hypothetical protein
LVAIEGDLVNVRSESVGMVAEGVLDRTEDLFGWRVDECLGHRAGTLLEQRLDPVLEPPEPRLTVFDRGGNGTVRVGHGRLTGGISRHRY